LVANQKTLILAGDVLGAGIERRLHDGVLLDLRRVDVDLPFFVEHPADGVRRSEVAAELAHPCSGLRRPCAWGCRDGVDEERDAAGPYPS